MDNQYEMFDDYFGTYEPFDDDFAYYENITPNPAATLLPGCTLLSENDGYYCQTINAENEKMCMAYKCPYVPEDSNMGRPIWNQRKEILQTYVNSSGLAAKCKAYGGKFGPSVYVRLGQKDPDGKRSSHAMMFSCSEIEGDGSGGGGA
jgi:hypothetical protein